MEHVDTLFGIVLPYANFFIFLGLAIYFFKKPAREQATKKKEAYDKLLAEASAAKAAATAKLTEIQKRFANLDKEVAELRSIAKDSSEQEAAKIVADAERVATHLKNEARRIADAEVARARATLRREIIEAVHAAASKKIETETSADTQAGLVRQRIAGLGSLHVNR